MEAILQTLTELEGVNGAVVADDRGHIVAYKSHAVYDATLLNEVSRAIATAIDSVKLLHEQWESITAQFSDGRLLIRSIPVTTRGKGPEHTLSVIADTRLNPSFAGVAIRVAVSKLKSLCEAGGFTPAALSASGGAGRLPAAGWANPMSPPIPVATPQQGRASIPDVANGGLSWSGFGSASAMSVSGISAVDAASAAVLTACTKGLARSVGPIAKRYVKEAVHRLWPDQPFSKDQTAILVSELEKYLQDPTQVAQFRKATLR